MTFYLYILVFFLIELIMNSEKLTIFIIPHSSIQSPSKHTKLSARVNIWNIIFRQHTHTKHIVFDNDDDKNERGKKKYLQK